MTASVTIPLDVGCRATLCAADRFCDAAIEFYVAHTYIWNEGDRYEAPGFQRAMHELVRDACRAHGCAYP